MSDHIGTLRVGLAHLAHALQEIGGHPPLTIGVDFETLLCVRSVVGPHAYFHFDHAKSEGVLSVDGVRFVTAKETAP